MKPKQQKKSARADTSPRQEVMIVDQDENDIPAVKVPRFLTLGSLLVEGGDQRAYLAGLDRGKTELDHMCPKVCVVMVLVHGIK